MIEITLKYKGKSYTQRTSANATIIEFTEELLKSHRSREEGEGLKDIEIATVKFIGFSKFAIDLSNEEHGRMKISELQVKEKKSYMMLASNLESVRKLRKDENVDLRIRGFEDEKKREKQRDPAYASRANKYAHKDVGFGSNHQYTFREIKVLNIPDGIVEPSKEKTREVLEKLKNDPGVKRVMEQKRYEVGLLSEMAPEGLVGVSETCVLGYNMNKGAAIYLRLRTDDWKGLRRYESIRRVLMHELAHNEISPHNAEFKALNSELVKLCERDWNRGRKVTNGDFRENDDGYDSLSEDECMKETRKLSGQKLGVGNEERLTTTNRSSDARSIAGQKALERFNTTNNNNIKQYKCACGACVDNRITCIKQ